MDTATPKLSSVAASKKVKRSVQSMKVKKDYDKRLSKTRIVIGSAFHQWNELKERLQIPTHSQMAYFLLNSYKLCSCAPIQIMPQGQASPTTENETPAEECCAVCREDGELLSCEKCLKMFHLYCHVPTVSYESPSSGLWACSFCRDLPSLASGDDDGCHVRQESKTEGLPPDDRLRCERLLLGLYCNELSTDFQKPDCPLDSHRYKELIETPMDLSTVKRRLESNSASVERYVTPEEFVSDVRLIFLNCLKYYRETSEVGSAGLSLGNHFEEQLTALYPGRMFLEDGEERATALLQEEIKEEREN